MAASTTRFDSSSRAGPSSFVYDSQGVAASGVIRAGAGQVVQIVATNTNAATRYLQLFDSLTVPADTAVPTFCPIAVKTGETVTITLPLAFSTGIAWATSTTAATKTVAAAEMWVTAVTR